MCSEQISNSRRFVAEVARLAQGYQVNFFVVTDGASGINNHGNEAVEHARKCHEDWELAHGIDPKHDWSTEANALSPAQASANH